MRACSLEPSDYASLASFLEERTGGVYARDFWESRFRWWWDVNPAMSPSTTKGWLLKDAGGHIVGFLGNIPVLYSDKGKEEIVFSTTSWFVADQVKNRGLDLFVPFMQQKALLFDTTPSPKVQLLLPRLGFFRLERPWLVREAVFAGGLLPFLLFFVEKQASSARRVLAGAGTFMLLPLLWPLLYVRRMAWESRGHDYDVAVEEDFSTEYETLWNEVGARSPLLAVRRPKELAWFFHASGAVRARSLVLGVRRKGVLQGYAAFKIVKRKFFRTEYTCLEMVDLFLRKIDDGALVAVLQKAFSWSRQQGLRLPYIKVFPIAGSGPVLGALMCFWQMSRDTFWCRDNRPRGGENSDIAGTMFATPLDGDRFFF